MGKGKESRIINRRIYPCEDDPQLGRARTDPPAGAADRVTTLEKDEIQRLRRENKQAHGAGDPGTAASGSLGRPVQCTPNLRVRESVSGRRPIPAICRVLEVSTSGYYEWLRRPASAQRDDELSMRIGESSSQFARDAGCTVRAWS